jgi:hypothetical protein
MIIGPSNTMIAVTVAMLRLGGRDEGQWRHHEHQHREQCALAAVQMVR